MIRVLTKKIFYKKYIILKYLKNILFRILNKSAILICQLNVKR